MPARSRWYRVVLTALALLPAVACGGGAGEGDDGSSAGANDAAGGTATGADAAPVTLGAADLDAYERGLRREIELVRAARSRLTAAATPQERGAAVQAQWPDKTMPQAAAVVGMPAARYQQLRVMVDEVLRTLDFQGKIDGPLTMDTARATPEMRRRLASDPFASLSAPAAAALRERLPRLAPLWAEYTGLTAVGG